jgi:hypothetical protein
LNESMADSVKITVIATGFTPESARAILRPMPVEVAAPPPVAKVEPSLPEPEPAPPVIPDPLPPVIYHEPEEPAAMVAEAAPVLDMDDLEMPAYLRQGRLLN